MTGFLAARFGAAAVQELQEQSLLPFAPLDIAWLEQAGLPNGLEALGVFALVLLVAIPAFGPRRAPAQAAALAAAE